MNPELKQEITRLDQILSSFGLEFEPIDGANAQQLEQIENETGIRLGADLRDFYQYTNGSDEAIWFAVFSDELTPCAFPAIEDALECWSWFLPYDQSIYDEWNDFSSVRGERIKPGYLHHRLWFPIWEGLASVAKTTYKICLSIVRLIFAPHKTITTFCPLHC